MSEVLDYLVFMTYLRSAWPVGLGDRYSQDVCPGVNCRRSRANLTETVSALSTNTEAGVPSSKKIVGVANYGRSLGMIDPSCTGPTCVYTGLAYLYTGPNSTATPGPCTGTAGYTSQAELMLAYNADLPGTVSMAR